MGEACIKAIGRMPGVGVATGDQCQYEQEYRGEPIKKPTQWMSNASKLLERLSERCQGRGGHVRGSEADSIGAVQER